MNYLGTSRLQLARILTYRRLSSKRQERKERKQNLWRNRHNPDLERAARKGELFVPLEAVREEWLLHAGPYHIRDAVRHYGVFQHVFGGMEFIPEVDLRVTFEGSHVVNRGNFIGPSQCLKPPAVQFNNCGDNSLWTLVLTNPDGDFQTGDREILHWLVYNMSPSDGGVDTANTHCPYIPPCPPKGTGFHRLVFSVFHQNTHLSLPSKSYNSFDDRIFSTKQFWSDHASVIRPLGVHFFQTTWDSSVTDTFQNILGLKEPVYDVEKKPTKRKKQQIVQKKRFTQKHRWTM